LKKKTTAAAATADVIKYGDSDGGIAVDKHRGLMLT
jgi:hypothetical protein